MTHWKAFARRNVVVDSAAVAPLRATSSDQVSPVYATSKLNVTWKRRLRPLKVLSGGLIMAVGLAACSSSSSSSAASSSVRPKTKTVASITVGCDNSFFGCLPFFVARSEGFWAKNGLNVTYVGTTNTQATAAAMVSGSIDIGLGPDAFTLLSKYNMHVQYLTGLTGQFFEIIALPTVHACSGTPAERLKALKGVKIGVSGIDSEAYYSVLDALKTVGMTASDVTFVNIQGLLTPELAALKAGSIQALMTDPVGAAELASDGVCTVANYADPGYLPSALQNTVQGMEAKKSWIDANKTTAREFQTALSEAITWMQEPGNFTKDEALMRQVIGSSFTAAIVKSITADEVNHIAKGYENIASLQAIYNSDLSVGTIKPIPGINFASYLAPGVPTTPVAVKKLAGTLPG